MIAIRLHEWTATPFGGRPGGRALHRTVASPAREQADALFLATLVEARAWLRPLLTGEAPEVRAATGERADVVQLDRTALEEHISHYLHHLLAVSASTAGLTVRVRAAQVAAFRLGWLLSVNLPRLVATADEPSVATRRNPHTWHALRVRDTVRAALLDVGAPLLSRKVDATWAANDWLNRWGIALQEVS